MHIQGKYIMSWYLVLFQGNYKEQQKSLQEELDKVCMIILILDICLYCEDSPGSVNISIVKDFFFYAEIFARI